MRDTAHAPPLLAVGLISAAALAYEVLLTRVFAIVHWHHLVATAISLALLGYGASGTFVTLMRQRLEAHFAAAFVGNAMLFSISSLACVALAQRLPLDPQALSWEARQSGYLAATFLILALPFFAAANCIALALTHFKQDIPRLYGFDLVGAGLGALVLLLALAALPPADVLFGVFVSGILVTVSAARALCWHPGRVALVGALLIGVCWLWARPTIIPAAYKDLTRALNVIGATVDAEISGVAGMLTVVRNDRVPLRTAPGMSLQTAALPPRQMATFVDGDASGALGDFSGPGGSSDYLQDLTSALPYQLLQSPRVAVLNAGVGAKVQQALHLGASSVTAVEPNPLLHAIRCRTYVSSSGRICDPALVDWHIQAPRALLAASDTQFDLVTLEAHADPAGLDALSIDFDITREALLGYLEHLTPHGLLVIEGPSRNPPRLSLRAIATARAALQLSGIDHPQRHIAMIRGWQRFTMLVSKAPLDAAAELAIRSFAEGRAFDLVWIPGIRPADANRFQQLAEPLFFLGAAAILDPTRPTTDLNARFRLQATNDDRPFANLFTRWTEWWAAFTRGGRPALAQLDTGLFVATVTLPMVTLIGIALILLPLLRRQREPGAPAFAANRLGILLYFGILGFAFLFIEIAWIQRLQLFLGHPVHATTAVLAAFLVFAGLGSLWAQRRRADAARGLLALVTLWILFFCLAYIFLLPAWLSTLSHLPLAGRIGIVFVLLAPLAFAMGVPFPVGLRALGRDNAPLIPWAWAINGCASVIAAVSTPLLAVEVGFSGLIGVAAAGYLILPAIRLGGGDERRLPRGSDLPG